MHPSIFKTIFKKRWFTSLRSPTVARGYAMRVIFLLAILLLTMQVNALATSATNMVSTNDVLIIERCVTGVAGGKCKLTIGPLRPTGDVYSGDYSTKVSPYFFKNEGGKLAIVITRDSIDKASKGLAVDVTGTATGKGEAGKTRRIDATATPMDARQGTLRLRFVADGREMVFNTSYKFVAPDSEEQAEN
jgi:hypothetical protein